MPERLFQKKSISFVRKVASRHPISKSNQSQRPDLVYNFNQMSVPLARTAVQRRQNQTGLPDRLKAGVENLSGLSLDDVKVHYNSPIPDTLQALAYTQGTEIHLGPGQEKHLPHEAWHVVQQKLGRVKPTLQVSGIPVNDAADLEREAERVGAKAVQMKMPSSTQTAWQTQTRSESQGRQHVTLHSGGQEIGGADVTPISEDAVELTNLKVDASQRKNGGGQAILKQATQAARAMGKSIIRLESQDNGSGRLTRWYEKQGFKRKGIGPHGLTLMEATAVQQQTHNPSCNYPACSPPAKSTVQLQHQTYSCNCPACAGTMSSTPKLNAPNRNPLQKMDRPRRDSTYSNPFGAPRKRGTARTRAMAGDDTALKPNYIPPKDKHGDKIWDGSRKSLSWNDDAYVLGVHGGPCPKCGLQPANTIDHDPPFSEMQAELEMTEVCDGKHHWEAVMKEAADSAYNYGSKLQWMCGNCNSSKGGVKGMYENQPKWIGACPGDTCLL